MLQLFREYLIKFDYPNIHQLTEDEVANIFDANNRLFLLTWIIKQIDYSYISEMDSKHSEILLADFIFEHGFCRSSQKDLFVKGDSKLDLCEQVHILNRMLSTLDDVYEERKQSVINVSDGVCPLQQQLSCSELKTFLNEDLNLFPSFGGTKVRTSQQRQDTIKKYQSELQNLKADVEKLKENDISLGNKIEFNNINGKLDDNLQQLKNSTVDLCANASMLSQQKNKFHAPNFKLNINKEFASKCDENFTEALKIIENTNTISAFTEVSNKTVSPLYNENGDDSCFNVIKNQILPALRDLK